MKNNYKLILCLLVVIIASLSCVTANEDLNTTTTGNNGDTSITTHDGLNLKYDETPMVNNIDNGNNNKGDVDLEAADSGDRLYSQKNSNDIKSSTKNMPVSSENHAKLYSTISTTYDTSSDTKNFTYLQNALNKKENNGTLYLNGTTYIFNGTDDNNNKSLNITNKNITIDGSNGSSGFSIIDGNNTINILNITNGSNVTLKNIIFQNSNPIKKISGGAIYIGNDKKNNNNNNITIINCSFNNNTANKANDGGGAIYINGNTNITIIDCNFTNNTATGANYGGGAIYINNGTINIINSTFDNNKVNGSTSKGGAIYINSKSKNNISLIGCNFINNNANVSSGSGGAIHITNSNTNNITLIGCNFTNNSANSSGGAIGMGQCKINLTVIDCNFTNNLAKSGGAVFFNGNNSNFTRCNFIDNTIINLVGDSGGSAVYLKESGNFTYFTDCNFTNNTAITNTSKITGGTIYAYSFLFNVTGCNFIGNNATNYGAIVVYYRSSSNITNCSFINNKGRLGGAIVIYNYGSGSSNGRLFAVNNNTIDNCKFINNTATDNGGAIYLRNYNSNGTDKLNNCDFINNTANYGAGLYITATNSTNSSNKGSVNNCKFINNTAAGNGSGIYLNQEEFNFTNLIFNNNNANGSGGAVFLNTNSTGNFTNINFTNNNVNGSGGAVFLGINCTGNFINSNFINNTAGLAGGAVYIDINATGRFSNCTFINNTAIYGGVAYINSVNAPTISYSLFSMGNELNMGLGLFDGCVFDNNSANVAGGAVYNTGKLNVSDSEFENNTAKLTGGAIYTNNDANITNDIFWNNSVSNGNGGGIAVYGGDFNLVDSNFTDNSAPNGEGGAVYIGSRGNAMLDEVNFVNNSARVGPSIYSAGALSLNDVSTDYPFVNTGSLANANLTILENRTVDVYSDHVDIYAKLDQDINTTIYFQITTNETDISNAIYVKATYLGNATYYYRFNITQFGQTYTVSASSILSDIEKLTVKNATLISIDQFSIDITAKNVTVININSTANNTVDIYILNGNKVLYGNITVLVNGEEYIVNLTRSQAKLKLENLTPGEYNVTVVYGNGNATINNSTVFYVQYPVSINDTNIVFKDNGDNTTTVTVEFPPDATGNVTITVNGTEYNATIVNGIATFRVNGSYTDFANVSIYYPGNNVTGPLNESLVLDLRDIQLTINGTTVSAGENTTVNVDLTINNVPANENVTITVTGNDYDETFNASVVDGMGVLDLGVLAPGAYNVTVQYSDRVASTVVYVKNNITEEDITIEASKNANGTVDLTLTAPEGMTGNITFNIGGKNYTAEIINGKATVSTDQPYDEPFQVSVFYAGNDANYPFNYNYTFDTSKVSVTVENVTMYYRNGSGVIVNVGMGDTPLANQTVFITINGRTYNRTTDTDGSAKLTVNLNPGIYNVTTTYTGADGQNYTVESTVTVLSTISGENIVKYYRNATRYYATFLDGEGNRLAHKNVTFNINGVFYTAETDDNGTASLAINLLPDEYIITAYNPVNNESYSNNVTVLTTLETGNLVKYFRNATQFTAKITDGEGNVASGVLVTFNINGVFYSKYSDVNGVATLNINLNPGDYIITTNNTLTGQTIGNTVKVLPVLTGEDLTKVYGQPGYYVAHLVDSQGNPSSNQAVTFNINGRMYHAFTDALGDARLAINLMPGRYIITASANVNGGIQSNSNVITVVGSA